MKIKAFHNSKKKIKKLRKTTETSSNEKHFKSNFVDFFERKRTNIQEKNWIGTSRHQVDIARIIQLVY